MFEIDCFFKFYGPYLHNDRHLQYHPLHHRNFKNDDPVSDLTCY